MDKITLNQYDLARIANALHRKKKGIINEINRRFDEEGAIPEHLWVAKDNVDETYHKIQRFRKMHGLTNDPEV